MSQRHVFGSVGFTLAAVASSLGCASAPAGAARSSTSASETAASAAPLAVAAVSGPDAALLADAREELGALAPPPAGDPAVIALGRRLFFETGASADGSVGCVSCHLPERWGTDGRALSIGVMARENARNAPTVLNAGGQSAQHWRADRESLEQQASRALLGPASFGNPSEADASARLRQLPEAEAAFARAFPNDPAPVSIANWGTAIGAYERSLVNPAPFDAWLGGDAAALGADARRGLRVFLDIGCSECHDGALIGGRQLQKFGRTADYWSLTHSAKVDAGRFDVTHAEDDRYVFKVAALRNVAKTAPYFHDGSVASLPDAVSIMAKTQLGRDLSPDDRDAIVAFLGVLTGPIPADFAPPPVPGR